MNTTNEAVGGHFSFPKWALGVATAAFMFYGAWMLTISTSNASDIAVLKQRSEFSEKERTELRQEIAELKAEMKTQLDRIEAQQLVQSQTQTFILENLGNKKK